jgi:hypothetical protein
VGGIADRLTVLGFVIPSLQSHLPSSVWIAMAAACLCAAGLIVFEMRPRKR